MNIIHLSRESVIAQTAINLLAAGIIEDTDIEICKALLENLDPKDLLANLIESYQLREKAGGPDSYYIIDKANLNPN